MPRDGNGAYSRAGAPYAPATTISSTAVNAEMDDIASALTASVAADGQTVPTADLPMGGFKHTNVDDAALRAQYASAGQVQDGSEFVAKGLGHMSRAQWSGLSLFFGRVGNAGYSYEPTSDAQKDKSDARHD